MKRPASFYQHKLAATAAANIATYISGLRYFCAQKQISILSVISTGETLDFISWVRYFAP